MTETEQRRKLKRQLKGEHGAFTRVSELVNLPLAIVSMAFSANWRNVREKRRREIHTAAEQYLAAKNGAAK